MGEKHGDGTWYFPSGSVRYEGNYIDGVWKVRELLIMKVVVKIIKASGKVEKGMD